MKLLRYGSGTAAGAFSSCYAEKAGRIITDLRSRVRHEVAEYEYRLNEQIRVIQSNKRQVSGQTCSLSYMRHWQRKRVKLREKSNEEYLTVRENQGEGKISKVNESEVSLEAALSGTSEIRLEFWKQSLTRRVGVRKNLLRDRLSN
jgi:hypothetical protein